MYEETQEMPVLELRYQDYRVGVLDCACAFAPTDEDDV